MNFPAALNCLNDVWHGILCVEGQAPYHCTNDQLSIDIIRSNDRPSPVPTLSRLGKVLSHLLTEPIERVSHLDRRHHRKTHSFTVVPYA